MAPFVFPLDFPFVFPFVLSLVFSTLQNSTPPIGRLAFPGWALFDSKYRLTISTKCHTPLYPGRSSNHVVANLWITRFQMYLARLFSPSETRNAKITHQELPQPLYNPYLQGIAQSAEKPLP
jgi:hypothetical protein